MGEQLTLWMEEWAGVMLLGRVLLILAGAWLTQRLARRLIGGLEEGYHLPPELVVGSRRVSSFLIYGAALLLVLEQLGVSGTVLWTAFTGFAAVGAVAFFAAWSVLSNIFCAFLIFTTRPYRIHDYVELVDNGEQKGLRGRVIDINLVYTTLQEVVDGAETGSFLQIPNNLFFQRTLRRWRDGAGLRRPMPRPPAAPVEAADGGTD